jgi:hypothetical protein
MCFAVDYKLMSTLMIMICWNSRYKFRENESWQVMSGQSFVSAYNMWNNHYVEQPAKGY